MYCYTWSNNNASSPPWEDSINPLCLFHHTIPIFDLDRIFNQKNYIADFWWSKWAFLPWGGGGCQIQSILLQIFDHFKKISTFCFFLIKPFRQLMSPAPTKKKELGTDQGGGVISGGQILAGVPASQRCKFSRRTRRRDGARRRRQHLHLHHLCLNGWINNM